MSSDHKMNVSQARYSNVNVSDSVCHMLGVSQKLPPRAAYQLETSLILSPFLSVSVGTHQRIIPPLGFVLGPVLLWSLMNHVLLWLPGFSLSKVKLAQLCRSEDIVKNKNH